MRWDSFFMDGRKDKLAWTFCVTYVRKFLVLIKFSPFAGKSGIAIKNNPQIMLVMKFEENCEQIGFRHKRWMLKINVVGMSIEKMRRNDEMTNFGIFTQPIPMFFFEVQNWVSQDSAETAAHIT